MQPDGNFVVAGSTTSGDETDFFLARYRRDGTPDPSFGTGGIVVTDFAGRADAVGALLLLDDGSIVAAGSSAALGPSGVPGQADFAVARYRPDGSPDASFGSDGRTITDRGGEERAIDVEAYPLGRIVIAGPGGSARYESDGSLDASFGDGGTLPGGQLLGAEVFGDRIMLADRHTIFR